MKRHERRAHRRTERVTIQQIKAAAAVSDHGEVDKSDPDNWEDVATRWCRVQPKSASEQELDQQIISVSTTEFEFLHDSVTAAISPRNRLKHSGVIYEIDPPRNPEMRNELILVTGVAIE